MSSTDPGLNRKPTSHSGKQKTTTPQLSCTNCKARKARCDKGNPCSRCTEHRLTCTPVYRQRLPRGRHVHANGNNSLLQEIRPKEIETHGLRTKVRLAPPSGAVVVSTNTSEANIDAAQPAFRNKIWQIYADRVNPIVKLFHAPSLHAFLVNGEPYAECDNDGDVLDLVFSSVVLLSVVTLTAEQCITMLGVEKTSCLQKYRLACETALDQLDLFNTEDMLVLHSFVAFLIAIRSYDHSRSPWTLLSVAVRLATGLKINNDDSFTSETFFQQQMRRRLWYTICLLDAHFSFDRASEPMIIPESTHPKLPNNVDDTDFGPSFTHNTVPRDGLTDMSLALLLYHAQATGKVLGFQKSAMPEIRRQLFEHFETHVRRLVRHCESHSTAYAWCARNGSLGALASMQLHLQQPRNKSNNHNEAGDTDTDTDKRNHSTLVLAAKCLQNDLTMRTDPRGEPFRWWRVFHWHPLTVALTECNNCDDADLIRAVWPLIEEQFEQGRKVLTAHDTPLWTHHERLIAAARPHVRALLDPAESQDAVPRQSLPIQSAPDKLPPTSTVGAEPIPSDSYQDGSLYAGSLPSDLIDGQQYLDSLPMLEADFFEPWPDFLGDFSLTNNDDLISQLLFDGTISG